MDTNLFAIPTANNRRFRDIPTNVSEKSGIFVAGNRKNLDKSHFTFSRVISHKSLNHSKIISQSPKTITSRGPPVRKLVWYGDYYHNHCMFRMTNWPIAKAGTILWLGKAKSTPGVAKTDRRRIHAKSGITVEDPWLSPSPTLARGGLKLMGFNWSPKVQLVPLVARVPALPRPVVQVERRRRVRVDVRLVPRCSCGRCKSPCITFDAVTSHAWKKWKWKSVIIFSGF